MRIMRFDIASRALHWSHAVFFIWLLVTGIRIFLTPKSLLGDPLMRTVHLYSSVPFILLPAAIYLLGRPCDDVKELMSWTGGKFNSGQKANFMASVLLITGLTLSGFVVWMKSMFSVDFVELNFLVHDFLAVISILLLAGHIILALYYSESLRGIIYGHVDEKWAREHYPEWQRN